MNHKQILDTLAAASLVKALEFDIAYATNRNMLGPKWDKPDPASVSKAVISGVLRRWRCALDAPEAEVTANYKAKVWLAMAVLFHKYGFNDATVTAEARKAIDFLNKTVALSDHFFRKTDEIRCLLASPASALSKRPGHAEHVTFWRAGDVVAYMLDGWAYALYVHEVPLGNEVPLVELYDMRQRTRPELADLRGCKALGIELNDNRRYINILSLYGMRHQPDFAHQFHLLGTAPDFAPDQSQLNQGIGEYTLSDIFQLQNELPAQFARLTANS